VTALDVEAIDTSASEGAELKRTAEAILLELGEPDRSRLRLEQVRQVLHAREARPVSEKGVVLPSAADGELRQVLEQMVARTGGEAHPSGAQGITEELFAEHVAAVQRWLAWLAEGELPADGAHTSVMPLGDATPDAFAVLSGIRHKVDQFFAQCEAVRFSEAAAPLLTVDETDWKAIDLTDPAAIQQRMKEAPLATPVAAGILVSGDDVNPCYAAAVAQFFDQVVRPILGDEAAEEGIRADGWAHICQIFAPHADWASRACGHAFQGADRACLERALDPGLAEAFGTLVVGSRETAVLVDAVRTLEKVLLFQAYMLLFLNNYVSFPYLYDTSRRALFEMGTLIMDGRRLNFAVRVKDVAAHVASSQQSQIHMLYVEVTPGESDPFTVAVPVTSGGRGNLAVGKRGVFVTVDGEVHDARVSKCIENPISVTEALISPFQRMGKLLTGKIEKMTSSAEKQLDETTTASFDRVTTAPDAQAAATPAKGAVLGGALMGGGVALAALSSAAAYITSVFSNVGPWRVTAGLLVAVLAVVMPASIISILKLRRRDLSAVLEGCGWAINARMRLTFAQGRQFTLTPRVPGLPAGATPRTFLLLALLLLLIAIKTCQ
jgi:hypothetical protein